MHTTGSVGRPTKTPSMIRLHLSWAESRRQSDEQVVKERPNGGMPSPRADLRDHEDYEAMAEQGPEMG